ncbi:hypothetical protein IAR55_006713 [Kwoniella newhampshirensis]|uniref:Uncharacterized protein n=1 Tax=Kwoniella newhampshirensis TaxID=1651941 RepID=A0AAW0YT56_9TREE
MSSPKRAYSIPPPPVSATSSTTRMVQPSLDMMDQGALAGKGPVNDYAFFYTVKFKLCFISMCKSATRAGVLLLAIQLTMGPVLVIAAKVFWLALAFSIACLLAAACYTNINLKAAAEKDKELREAALNPVYPMGNSSEFKLDDPPVYE